MATAEQIKALIRSHFEGNPGCGVTERVPQSHGCGRASAAGGATSAYADFMAS